MATLALPITALLAPDLAEAYRQMAVGLKVTPDELALAVLEQRARDWRWSNRDRGGEPVVFRRPAPATPVTTVHTGRGSVYAGIRDALRACDEVDTATVIAWLAERGRWRWQVTTLRQAMYEMAGRGLIRRVRRGVYASAATAAREN